jgi:rRNA processing protein Krr1/Pno1
MVKEQVSIDHRVHARLIGQRGRAIHKVMEQYSVDIKFPRSTDPDPSLVSIIGSEENVAEAKEHLLNLTEEYVRLESFILKSPSVI